MAKRGGQRPYGWAAAAVHVAVFGSAAAIAAIAGPALALPTVTWWVLAVIAVVGLPFALLLVRDPRDAPSHSRVRLPSPPQSRRAGAGTPGRVAGSRAGDSTGTTPVPARSTEGSGVRLAAKAGPAAGAVGVLPFTVAGSDPSIEHLADGLTEEVLLGLGRLEEFSVPARGSVFALRGGDRPIEEIAARLRVGHVLEGVVAKEGGRLQVKAVLRRASDRSPVWKGEAEGNLGELGHLATRLVHGATHARGAPLPEAASAPSVGRSTADGAACDAYFRGRSLFHQSLEGVKRSTALFEQAVRADARFALAHARRAEAHVLLAFYSLMTPAAAFETARESAREALALDEHLPEAWAALGFVQAFRDWDWTRASVSFQKAVDLNPSFVPARFWYALSLGAAGDVVERVRQTSLALRSDPVSTSANAHVGWALLGGRAFDHAERRMTRVLRQDPDHALAYWVRGRARIHSGAGVAGLDDLIEAAKRSRTNPVFIGSLGYAVASAGRTSRAQRHLTDLRAGPAGWRWVPESQIATIELGLSRPEDALDSLERALEQRDPWLPLTMRRPEWDAHRSHERFRQILSLLGVSEVAGSEYGRIRDALPGAGPQNSEG